VLLGAPLVTARSQTSVENDSKGADLFRVAATDISRSGIGALTLERRGGEIPTSPMVYAGFLSAAPVFSSISVDGGTLLWRTGSPSSTFEGSSLQPGAAPWAALDQTGKSADLLDLKDTEHVERNFELTFFAVVAIILSVSLMAVGSFLQSRVLVKLGRSLCSAVARRRVEDGAVEPVFGGVVSQHAE